MLIRLFAILFVCYYSQASAQSLSNFRAFKLIPTSDTITLDSVSILESGFEIRLQDGSSLASALYVLNPYTTDVIIAKGLIGQELYFSYRTFPFLFSRRYYSKDYTAYKKQTSEQGFIIQSAQVNRSNSSSTGLIDFGELDYNGNLSRGVGFGNAQSLNVNSSFNIQLSGMITDDIEVKAAITDNNIPIQPEGNTAQLQEFDKVFIQLRKDQHFLTVGDFDLKSVDPFLVE